MVNNMHNEISLKQQGRTTPSVCPGLSCRNRILRWVTPQVKNPDDAEDICGEICLHCLRGLQRFRGDAEFETWLYRIIRNVLNDFLWAKRRRAETENIADTEVCSALQSSTAQLPDTNIDSARVRAALCQLASIQRHLIEWKYGDGLTHAEIASRLHISEAAASQALYRARKAFKKAYAADEGDPSS